MGASRLVLETEEYVIYMALFNVLVLKYSMSFQNNPITSSNAPGDFWYGVDRAARELMGTGEELRELLGLVEEPKELMEFWGILRNRQKES